MGPDQFSCFSDAFYAKGSRYYPETIMCGLLEKYLVDRSADGLKAVLTKHGINPSDRKGKGDRN